VKGNIKKFLNLIHHGDKNLFFLFNHKIRCKYLDIIMPKITHLGGATFSLFVCLFFYLFGKVEAKSAALEAFITLTGSQGVVQFFKKTIYRKRPYLDLPNVNTFWKKLLKDYSFPSGHTAAGFSIAAIFAFYFPAYSYLIYSLAALVGVSRIYTGMHYPSDVLSGALVGTLFAFITHALTGTNGF